jgi:hypothetical protein
MASLNFKGLFFVAWRVVLPRCFPSEATRVGSCSELQPTPLLSSCSPYQFTKFEMHEYASWFVPPDKKPTVSADSNSDTKPLALLARVRLPKTAKMSPIHESPVQ